MGFRGIPSADVIFDDVQVPDENLVVGAGGFRQLFQIFSIERLGNTTMSLAIAQAALDRTIAYVQERRQFGKPLIEFQAVQMTLADMVLQVEGARQLLVRAAGNAGTGLPDPFEVSVAKTHGQRDGQAGHRPGHAAARRQRLHRGVRHRAAAPRRARLGHRRRHADDAAHPHRVRAARPLLRPATLTGELMGRIGIDDLEDLRTLRLDDESRDELLSVADRMHLHLRRRRGLAERRRHELPVRRTSAFWLTATRTRAHARAIARRTRA